MKKYTNDNIEFVYLYRDAGNYKFWNSMIFANPAAMSLDEAEKRIRHSLDSRELFIAHQIRIPETFPFLNSTLTEDDHCFHELAFIKPTTEAPDDTYGRSLSELVEEIEDVAHRGWRVFDPRYLMR